MNRLSCVSREAPLSGVTLRRVTTVAGDGAAYGEDHMGLIYIVLDTGDKVCFFPEHVVFLDQKKEPTARPWYIRLADYLLMRSPQA